MDAKTTSMRAIEGRAHTRASCCIPCQSTIVPPPPVPCWPALKWLRARTSPCDCNFTDLAAYFESSCSDMALSRLRIMQGNDYQLIIMHGWEDLCGGSWRRERYVIIHHGLQCFPLFFFYLFFSPSHFLSSGRGLVWVSSAWKPPLLKSGVTYITQEKTAGFLFSLGFSFFNFDEDTELHKCKCN